MENLNYIRTLARKFSKNEFKVARKFSKNEFKYKLLIIYIDEQL
jgi:hypothetical protein